MGLDISHNAWHGAYSAFMRWRMKIAEVSGLPDLNKMEGFTDDKNAIKFDTKHPLTPLLYHSDCDGYINRSKLPGIIDALTKILPFLEKEDGGGHIGNYAEKTQTFIDGCKLALEKKQRLEFH